MIGLAEDEFDPEFEAILAMMKDAPKLTFHELEANCFGSIVVSTVNEQAGRDNCIRCHQKEACDKHLASMRDELPIAKCFGDHEKYHPNVIPKEFCSICKVSEECVEVRRVLHYGIVKITSPAVAAAPPDVEVAAPTETFKIETRSIESERYEFPIKEIQSSGMLATYLAMHTVDLVAELRMFKPLVSTLPKTTYTPHRRAICAINIALNEHGDYMPRFRPGPNGNFRNRGKPHSPEDAMLANDRRVIELDWLARNRKKPGRGEAARLFSATGLDFKAASQFASTPGGADKKARILGLTTIDQVPLSAIQDLSVAERWKTLQRNKTDAVVAIENAIELNHGRREDSPEWLWMIYALYRLTDRHKTQLRQLAAKVGHPAPTRQRLDRVLAWLKAEAHLPM